jgi:hypothetical protein
VSPEESGAKSAVGGDRNVLSALGENAQVLGLEVSARSREDPEERRHRHRVETGILFFGGLVVAGLLVFAMQGTWSANAEIQKTASGMLTSILTGVLGFFAGRGIKA